MCTELIYFLHFKDLLAKLYRGFVANYIQYESKVDDYCLFTCLALTLGAGSRGQTFEGNVWQLVIKQTRQEIMKLHAWLHFYVYPKNIWYRINMHLESTIIYFTYTAVYKSKSHLQNKSKYRGKLQFPVVEWELLG